MEDEGLVRVVVEVHGGVATVTTSGPVRLCLIDHDNLKMADGTEEEIRAEIDGSLRFFREEGDPAAVDAVLADARREYRLDDRSPGGVAFAP